MTELVRSDPGTAGISRRRCGRGFRYLRADGAAVRDPDTKNPNLPAFVLALAV